MANIFGPDGNLSINLDQVAGLFSLRNGSVVKLTTEILGTPPLPASAVRSISVNFTSDAAYENCGIVYVVNGDVSNENNYNFLFKMGYNFPSDPSDRNIKINTRSWSLAAGPSWNPGGIDPVNKIYFVFAAWHRVSANDPNSPWIQNDLQSVNNHKGEVHNNNDGSPGTNIFKFEDLTGGEARDDDYDDMIMTATFNY